MCLSTYLSIYLASFVPVCLSKSVCLSIYLSIGPNFSLCVCLSLFICVSIYLFTCLSVRLASLFSVCQSIYLRLPVCLPVYYNMRHLHRMWCGSTGGPNASRKNTKQTQSWWGQQSVGNPTTFRWHPTLMTPSLASLKSCKSKPKNRGRLDLGLGGGRYFGCAIGTRYSALELGANNLSHSDSGTGGDNKGRVTLAQTYA